MGFIGKIAHYIDPLALLIVFGGTLLITVLRSPRADLSRAWQAFSILRSADPDADAQAARTAVGNIRELAEARSIMCADRVATAQRFLSRAARQLSDSRDSTAFCRWTAAEIESRRTRHQGAIGVWRSAAETAPAMGMIGTIIGLVQMFAAMSDPAAMGPGMAVAMLTTLYGVILSAMVAGPIAGRLERLSETELAWQQDALKQLEMLARAELDQVPAKSSRPHLRTVP